MTRSRTVDLSQSSSAEQAELTRCQVALLDRLTRRPVMNRTENNGLSHFRRYGWSL